MHKNRKVDKVPVDKSKKFLWAYLKEKVMMKEKTGFFSIFTPLRLSLAGVTAVALTVALIISQNFTFIDVIKGNPNTAFANFSMEASNEDSAGITPDSSFVLKSDIDLPAKTIQENLVLSPDAKFSVEKISEGEYEIVPTLTLDPDTVYNFKIASALDNFSFSYQVKNDFKIMSTIPGDQMSYIPLKSGIEIKFNNDNFDFDNVKNFFEISPKTAGRYEKHGKTLVFVPNSGLLPATIYTVTIKKGFKILDSNLSLNEEKVFKFETISEEKNNYDNVSFSRSFFEVKPGRDLAVSVYSGFEKNLESKVEIFKYDSSSEFLKDFKAINDIPSWANGLKRAFRNETNSLKSLGVFDSKIDEVNYSNFLYVPDLKLEKGFYLVEIQDEMRSQALVQVTDLAIFADVSLSDTMVWAVNLSNGDVADNVKIKFLNSGKEGKTDASGIYKFSTQDDFKEDYLVATVKYFSASDSLGNETFIALFPNSNKYKSYEYNISSSFDKSMYLPNDKMNFWGFAEKKSGEKPSSLKVEILYNYQNVYDSFEMNLENGFFKSEFLLKNAPIGSYYVEIYDGENIISSKYFEVANYIKPAYEIVVDSPRRNYFVGEKIEVEISARYFDGTPLSYIELEYSENYKGDRIKIQLDEFGKAKVDFIAQNTSDDFSKYFSIKDYNYIEAYSPQAEETNISGSFNANVFRSKVYLKANSEHKEGIATVKVESNYVDLDKSEKEGIYDYYSFVGESAKQQKISGKITKVRFEKFKTGEHYDFINKVIVDEFSYNRIEENFEDFNMTSDNSGSASYTFKTEEDGYYEVQLITYDKDSAVSKAFTTVYGNFVDPNDKYLNINLKNSENDNEDNSFKINDKIEAYVSNGEVPLTDSTKGKFLFMENLNGIIDYKVQDSPKYSTIFNENKLPGFYVSAIWFDGEDLKQIYASKANFDVKERELNIEMKSDKEKYLPGEDVSLDFHVTDKNGKGVSANLNINAIDEAYYKIAYDNVVNPINDIYSNSIDGNLFSYISHVNPSNMMFATGMDKGGCFTGNTLITMADSSVKNISDIVSGDEILTRKNPYSAELVPAKVVNTVRHLVDGYYLINGTLEVTGEHIVFANGQFSEVSKLSIGDTLTGLDGEIIPIFSMKKIPGQVYVYNFEVQNFHTYFANGVYVHNDKGAGGVRSDFKDSALFETIKTDSSGNANVKFKLPDNISSWRVSTKAVDLETLSAGISFDPIVVTKPMFVDGVINRQYSVKDSVQIVLRAFGTDLEKDDIVNFEISSSNLSFVDVLKLSGKAFKNHYVQLPNFKIEGNYDVTFSAKKDKLNDAVKRTFDVVGSRLKKTYSDLTPKINAGEEINKITNTLTEVVFTDSFYGTYYNELLKLYFSEGSRIDQAVLQKMSADLLMKNFDEKFFVKEEIDSLSYQNDIDGGLSLLPYSSSDLELSALITLMGYDVENYFSKEILSDYFYEIMDNSKSNTEELVFALSGLAGLDEPVLKSIKKMSEESSLSSKEKILLGLGLAKFGDRAGAKLIYEELKVVSAMGDYERALYAILSAYCGDQDYLNIWRNVDVKGINDDILNIFRLGLANFGLENSNKSEGEMEISVNGVVSKLDFKKPLTTHRLTVLASDSVKILKVKGDISMLSVYEKNIEENDYLSDKDVEISRKYFVNNKETNAFKEGDLVKVQISLKLNRDFAKSGFVVTDILPSGLYPVTQSLFGVRYLPYGYNEGTIWPFNINGQELKFFMGYFDKDKNDIQTISYFARVVSPGKYFADSVKAESWSDPNISSISDSDYVEISQK